MKKEDNQVVEQFLTMLEKLILKQESGIESIKERKRQRRYIKDLLSVLNSFKVGFADEVYHSKKNKQQEFLDILKIVISNDREYHRIVDEILNLYYLKDSGLIDCEEVRPQRDVCEAALDEVIEKCNLYLDTIEDREDDKRIKDLYDYMEKLFEIASCFDDNRLVSEIKDYDFFLEVVRDSHLPESVKLDLVFYIFRRTNDLKEKKEKHQYVNFYQELEAFYGKNLSENTDELLDEVFDISGHSKLL